MRKLFFNFKLDFSQQLAITLIAGAICLALATSVSIAIINAKSVKEQITQQAIYLTDLIARQSRLSLLYKSETGAEEVANIALQFPDIAGIKIIADDGQVLFDNFSKEKVSSLPQNLSKTILASEDDDNLLFLAPVITETIDVSIWEEEVENPTPEPSAIGYVYLYFSKAPLKAIQSEILRTNLWISAGAALLLLAAVLLLTRKMTKPLVALSRVMNRAQHGEIELRAEKRGPKDIVSMQESFNTMMEAIELRDKELRKARDIALETAAIKSQFAANVSHELRTPMNSVMGMLDLLSHMGLTGKNQEYVDTAKSSAQNLLELIDDILSYVHADSGEIILENDYCDIEELFEGVVNLLSTQALRKKVDLGYVLKGQIRTINIDYQRIKQVLINLLGNAIKFTESGQIALHGEVALKPGNAYELIIEVRDTGIGIQPENQQKIFEAFTQEDSSTTRKYGGTGLGLAICKQFITLMDGTVEVVSEPGEGSNFIITVPVEVLERKKLPAVELENLKVSNFKAVIAEDSPIVGEFLNDWFAGLGAECIACNNIIELIDLVTLNADHGDKELVLFVDESLPGLNVDSLMHILNSHEPELNAKVVLLVNPWLSETTYSTKQCLLLEKPLTAKKLVDFFRSSILTHAITQDTVETVCPTFKRKILIVDDNHANRLVARGMLEQFGCNYEFAENGKEAIDKVTRKTFDMVFMDCNMPVLDGYEATRTIRKLENNKMKIPIIGMTANNSLEERERCISEGMNDLLVKPLSLLMIERLLKEYFVEDPAFNTANKYSKDLVEKPIINQLKESVGEVFGAVIEAYIDDLPVYLNTLRAAITKNDYQQVYELAHTIKGSSSTLGASTLSEIAKDLELKGKEKDLRGAEGLFSHLESLSVQVIEILKGYVDKLPHSSSNLVKSDHQPAVLIADDDRSMRMAFANALRPEGYRIVEATNGQSVLAICARSMPDIILVDAIMPELDGFETCKQIRQLHNGSDVPILMVTSLEDEKSITRAFNVGATDYVTKPVNFSVLKQRVSRVLQTSKIEKHVRELAYHDVLTGLPNRAFFAQQLRHKLNRATLNNKKLAILFLDLDRFKMINDSLGHDAGDLILKAAAERISRCVRNNDLVARMGGDEFTVVLEDIDNPEVAGEISKKICDSLRAPFVFLHQRMFISASVGIAVFPSDGDDMNTLIKHADTAMFRAKEAGKDFFYYKAGMEDEVTEKLQIERDLRSAIERDEMMMYYQPQIDLMTEEVVGFEALVRWNHPDKGVLAAGYFIPIAEESGLIDQFAKLAFEKGCQQLEEWNLEKIKVRLAVNVSGGEFQDGHLREQIFSLFENYTFPPEMLEIEITETMLMEHPELAQSELALLRERGLSIAIDDFGSGFSSLNYLKRFSVDILKIDREFVKDCHIDKNDRAIIAGVVTLAKSLNLQVIAEGIETREQAEFLRGVGCDIAQGYYYGRPMSAEDINAEIRSGKLRVKRAR